MVRLPSLALDSGRSALDFSVAKARVELARPCGHDLLSVGPPTMLRMVPGGAPTKFHHLAAFSDLDGN